MNSDEITESRESYWLVRRFKSIYFQRQSIVCMQFLERQKRRGRVIDEELCNRIFKVERHLLK